MPGADQQALAIDVERVAKRSTSRVVRRPGDDEAMTPRAAVAFLETLRTALDRAGVKPGESFYVHRVPPPDRRSHSADFAAKPGQRAEQRRVLLQHYARRGNLGNTATDAAISVGDDGTWRRASELKAGGLLQASGRRKRTINGGMAAVLVITDRGRAALEAS